jgi:hypothetical protein
MPSGPTPQIVDHDWAPTARLLSLVEMVSRNHAPSSCPLLLLGVTCGLDAMGLSGSRMLGLARAGLRGTPDLHHQGRRLRHTQQAEGTRCSSGCLGSYY